MNASPRNLESLAYAGVPSSTAQSVADLWTTLGRAFLPPQQVEHWRAMHADLPLDLKEWSRQLGMEGAPRSEALLEAMMAYPEHEDLLVHYSSLFYAPPIRVHLNVGMYLDGGLNGPTQDHLARWHAAYGLARSSRFHDLTDHLAAVLEFLGLITRLEETHEAAKFAQTFLLPAVPRIIQAMEEEGAMGSPYLWLLRYLHHALVELYPGQPEAETPRRPRYRKRAIGDGWRRCARCEKPIATERELAVMEKALHQAGLPSDHLRLCPDCRDAVQGLEHRALPKVR
ncbi:MAG: molecular chaperone TorD family protein [Thiobacillaceae bacterium]